MREYLGQSSYGKWREPNILSWKTNVASQEHLPWLGQKVMAHQVCYSALPQVQWKRKESNCSWDFITAPLIITTLTCSKMLCLRSHLKLISRKRLRRIQSKACWAFRACRNQEHVDCLLDKSWKSFCCVTTFVVNSGAWLMTKLFSNQSISQFLWFVPNDDVRVILFSTKNWAC